jgi:hypothetical protein
MKRDHESNNAATGLRRRTELVELYYAGREVGVTSD